jgi:potassium-dependent mechanosensitive channel
MRTMTRIGCVLWLTITAATLPTAHAAATRPPAQPQIDSARAAIQAGNLAEPERQAALAQLDAATADEREAENLQSRLVDLRAEAAAQPTTLARLQRALQVDHAQAIAEWSARLPRSADAETLERLLVQERNQIAGIDAEIEAVASDLAQLLSRPAQASGEIATLRRRIDQLATPPAAVDGEVPAVAEARRLRRASELRRLQTELDLRLLEQDTATNRQTVYELTLRELRYRQRLHTQRVEVLQDRIATLARSQTEALLVRLADAEASSFAGSPGVAATAAADNSALGRDLIAQNERLARDRAMLASIEQARAAVAATLRDSRTRLELGGRSDAVGRWLWSERRRLEAPARLERRLEDTRSDLADLRLRLVELNEQQRGLLDLNAAARALADTDSHEFEGEVAAQPSADALVPLLRQRQELLDMLAPLLQRRVSALEQSERALQDQLAQTLELHRLLDRHLLWIPSHAPIDASWLQRLPHGLYDLVKPARFATTLDLAWRTTQVRPLPWLLGLVLLLALVELRRRAPAHIEAQSSVTRQIRRDSYPATLRALGWTLLAALPGPVALWLLGSLLQQVGNPGRYSDSLGRAITMLAVPLLVVQFLRWTAMERGLGHAHFRWMRQRREALLRTLPVTAAIVLPMYFVSALAFIRNLDLPNDVQARVAIIVACLTLAWTVWQLLAPGKLWVVRGIELEPSALRRALRVVLPVAVLMVAVLALAGYVYSAGMLLQSIIATFILAVAVALAVGLLARWFLLGERRLAWRRVEERKLAAEAAAAERSEPTPEPEPEITLEQVNAQTRRLLRALRLSLVAGGLIWVWSDALPAVARLDEIALWTFTDTGPDGTKVTLPVTLMAVLLGVVTLALTAVGARNMPGLIEIGLLSRTRIDAASRYAITSILRYAIVIAGSLIGLGLLGMRWSQLQWMAAALTVGLGFGLQEIFANFVSGLILLFERPFRVGDVITVGELSGRVTRIRTRATTILDFDNKEIMVPNKNFITGQLINWTLTDTTTRVIIKVGVAYGTDPRRVHDLLLQAARENTHVLADPAPTSWFLSFGASSLDFELRVFVSTVADRLAVQNALNMRVVELFAEHGIEIAFPQLDLHVRDLPAQFGGDGRAPAT